MNNINTKDRVIRALIGAVLLVASLFTSGVVFWILIALAAISIVQAIIGVCLFYKIIGKNSCPVRR